MVENEGRVDISKIVENAGKKPVVRLHLASYFRVSKTRREQERIYISHGLEPVYDPVRITPEIQEELWEDRSVDTNGFFTFPPKRLILGHTLENIKVPADIGLRMREFFYSEKTGKILPLTTNWGAPLIHPGSTGPQTYEIFNMSNQPLSVRVAKLICYLDVDYFNEPSVSAQQKMSKGEFGNQVPGKIKLGNPGKDWEVQAIRKALGLS
ncbi:MAG: hypothetical protein AAB662_03190 [Patescibacteria group bacterium]